jgi:hypothetical protein
MARFWLALFVLPMCVVGCLDRARVNTRCEWDEQSVRALDLNDWSQLRHLYQDVELAEELAIRYADEVHKERFGFDGFISWMIVGVIARRFPVDDGWPTLIAPLLIRFPSAWRHSSSSFYGAGDWKRFGLETVT